MNIIKIDPQTPKDLLVIKLMISNVCNYNCWYCFPGSNEGTHRWPKDTYTLYKNLEHLIEHYKTIGKTKIRLHIIGGEPTLWPELGSFAKHFKTKYDCSITMSTNASRTVRWWRKYGEYFDDVIISCHHQFVDVEHVKRVADTLYEKHVIVNGMVMMDPSNWDRCVEIVEELKFSKHSWYITCNQVLHYKLSLTEDQENYLKKSVKRRPSFLYMLLNGNYHNKEKKTKITFAGGKAIFVEKNWLMMNNLFDYRGMQCNVGVDIVFIDKEGRITGSCNNKLYDIEHEFNIYDNNFSKEFNIDIVSTTCNTPMCSACNDELNLFKVLKI